MPIKMTCQCGKALNIPDAAAGKAVKCPGCQTVLRVPASGAAAASGPAKTGPAKTAPAGSALAKPQRPAAPQQAARRPAPAAPVAVDTSMDDLFNEEGFSQQVAAICPACRAEMQADAVLCTKCGFNKQTGTQLSGHKTPGLDISHGTMALQKAAADMARAKETQDRLSGNVGMPWWMLTLVLFLIVSSTAITVIAINVSRQIDNEGGGFNPLATFLALGFGACLTISLGAQFVLIFQAFKQNVKTGLLTMFVPCYILYFVAKNWVQTRRIFAILVLMGMVAGGFLAGAFAAGL
ncbi:hypothetical protein Pla52o_41850 [Novipirellula galeiformis]|uniref:Double zinc ribbon n=1 Tax=Novipirellula galeiformis TaxID=2528004 RepID=A0A5C6CCF7_9BACT|nr:hypothetical protein [Novipirellula galeiformis]TWU21151.1 hypothetical protein Pla52o_41850 [Novipirellula galeiformis]